MTLIRQLIRFTTSYYTLNKFNDMHIEFTSNIIQDTSIIQLSMAMKLLLRIWWSLFHYYLIHEFTHWNTIICYFIMQICHPFSLHITHITSYWWGTQGTHKMLSDAIHKTISKSATNFQLATCDLSTFISADIFCLNGDFVSSL